MQAAFLAHIGETLADIESKGLTKRERLIDGPQGARITVRSGAEKRELLNLCAQHEGAAFVRVEIRGSAEGRPATAQATGYR